MRRNGFVVLLLSLVTLLSAGSTVAQDGTPSAVGPSVGEAVSIPGPTGEPLGTITVTEVAEPFLNYLPDYPPVHGYHYVMVTLTVENTGSRPLRFDPRAIVLRDSDGFLSFATTVYRPEDDAQAPDFQSQELAAGGKNSGVIGFQALTSTELAGVLYAPDASVLVQLVDFGASEPPPSGEPLTVLASDNSDLASIIVEEVIDPFDGYADDAAPQRGSHYVMVSVTIVNSGVRPLLIDPRQIVVQDGDGFIYAPVGIRQNEQGALPVLERVELAPGGRATGAVGYLVLNGIALNRVVYVPGPDRMIFLTDLAA